MLDLSVPYIQRGIVEILLIPVAVVVALDAVGALLVTVVLIVPAATVRLFEPALRAQVATSALAAVEGLPAIWIADSFNIGLGPALAVLGAALYAVAALVVRVDAFRLVRA
jgi:zinc transport system permease protein